MPGSGQTWLAPRPPQLAAGKEGAPSPEGSSPQPSQSAPGPPSVVSPHRSPPLPRRCFGDRGGLGDGGAPRGEHRDGGPAAREERVSTGGPDLTALLGAEAQDSSPVCSPRGNGSNTVKASRDRHRRRQLPHHHCSPGYSWSHHLLHPSFPSCPLQEKFPQVSHIASGITTSSQPATQFSRSTGNKGNAAQPPSSPQPLLR